MFMDWLFAFFVILSAGFAIGAIALLLLRFNAWEIKKVREKKRALLEARVRELEKIRELEEQ
jgi:hypothetical protein